MDNVDKMNKKNRKLQIVLLVSVVIIISLLVIFIVINTSIKSQRIGGQRDEYGCLGPAGYSWNDSIGACVREWELDESQKEAARIAVLPLSYRVTIVEVQTLRCPGCFIVKLQRNDNQVISQVNLINWTYAWDCDGYSVDDCPEHCVVCPPCEACSSLRCQTEEACASIGFGREWYDNITKALAGQK